MTTMRPLPKSATRSARKTGRPFFRFAFFFLPLFIAYIGILFLFQTDITPDFLAFLAWYFVLNGIIFALFTLHNKLTDASTIFLIFFAFNYSLIIPFYGFGEINHAFKSLLEFNWPLLTKGVQGAILALLGYSVGLLLSREKQSKKTKQTIAPTNISRRNIKRLCAMSIGLGLFAWFVIWAQTGFTPDVLFGLPADRRGIGLMIGGGFLYDLLFMLVHGFLLYTLLFPKRPLISPGHLLLFVFTSYFLLIEGARLPILTLALAALVLNILMGRSLKDLGIARFERMIAKQRFSIILIVVVFLFLLNYTVYRSNYTGMGLIYVFMNSIADSGGYFQIIESVPDDIDYWYGKSYLKPFIIYIPKAIFPAKYDYVYGINRYTEDFYNYDAIRDVTTTSQTYSLLGEIFINFGWAGLFFLMIFFGYLNNKIVQHAHSAKSSFVFKSSYSIYMSGAIIYGLKSGIATMMMYCFQKIFLVFIIPYFLLQLLTRKKPKVTRRY